NAPTPLIFLAVLLLVGALSALMAPAVRGATGLIAAYNFDENNGSTAADASGNGNTANLFGGTTALCCNPAAFTYTPSVSGLVAAYNFDENNGSTAADASGNGNTATLFEGTTWVSGHTGSALNFDGTSGYSTAPTVPYLENWSVSVWVRSPAAPSASNYSGPV